ncbi:hypothetical protein [Marinigracilibium pacificum]|uniref:Uncharacterized protein n=1 Tax=Marinigracilibium pacificum TaxID=2729599 RepID=A0A848J3N3_9BACT|nr:hypothetical protein [Marinigracilibium pacificum]NMM50346.1 hypothetical protein [Marinigracilibium pacificum]
MNKVIIRKQGTIRQLFIFIFMIGLNILSCTNEKEDTNGKENINVQQNINPQNEDEIFQQFKSLYFELLEFKDDEKFKKYGFSKGGPYNKWLTKVEEIESNPDSKLLMKKGILIGELKTLGMTYANSKGEETQVTKSFNEMFSNAINENPK